MKGCSAFLKAPASLEPYHQIVSYHIQDTCWEEESYSSAEMLTVYSAASANWANHFLFDKKHMWNLHFNEYIYIYIYQILLMNRM